MSPTRHASIAGRANAARTLVRITPRDES